MFWFRWNWNTGQLRWSGIMMWSMKGCASVVGACRRVECAAKGCSQCAARFVRQRGERDARSVAWSLTAWKGRLWVFQLLRWDVGCLKRRVVLLTRDLPSMSSVKRWYLNNEITCRILRVNYAMKTSWDIQSLLCVFS